MDVGAAGGFVGVVDCADDATAAAVDAAVVVVAVLGIKGVDDGVAVEEAVVGVEAGACQWHRCRYGYLTTMAYVKTSQMRASLGGCYPYSHR